VERRVVGEGEGLVRVGKEGEEGHRLFGEQSAVLAPTRASLLKEDSRHAAGRHRWRGSEAT
jgi:hypothetical protein